MEISAKMLVLAAALAGLSGAQSKATFKIVQRRAIPGTQLDAVTTVAEIPPGVTSGRHSHPGEDYGYLIEGTIVLMVDGKAPVTLHAGDTFYTERGHFHNAKNIGTTTARAVDTYVIDRGAAAIIPEH